MKHPTDETQEMVNIDSSAMKILVIQKGLTISSMAPDLADQGKSVNGMRTRLTALLYGRTFYPDLAKRVEKKYNIKVTRQNHQISIQESIRASAKETRPD